MEISGVPPFDSNAKLPVDWLSTPAPFTSTSPIGPQQKFPNESEAAPAFWSSTPSRVSELAPLLRRRVAVWGISRAPKPVSVPPIQSIESVTVRLAPPMPLSPPP